MYLPSKSSVLISLIKFAFFFFPLVLLLSIPLAFPLLLLLFLLVALYFFFYWKKVKFILEPHRVILHSGLLFSTTTCLYRDKIQMIQIHSDFICHPFHCVSLTLFTNTGKGKLAYLNKEEAFALKAELEGVYPSPTPSDLF